MSLERFSNIDDFLVTPSSVSNVMPNKWTDTLTAGGALIKYPINFTFLNEILEQTITEAHFYSAAEGAYVTSLYGLQTFLVPTSKRDPKSLNSINIPTNEIIQRLPSITGNHLMVVNLHASIPGGGTYDNPAFKIAEISPSRLEIHLKANTDYTNYAELQDITTFLDQPILNDELDNGNIVLNFGSNEVYTVVNIDRWTDPDGFIVKILKPLSDDLIEENLAWLQTESVDPLITYVNFVVTAQDNRVFLRAPNFEASDEFSSITETDFANYSQLLGSSTQTSEEIIQTMLSGSFGSTPIGIDYSISSLIK